MIRLTGPSEAAATSVFTACTERETVTQDNPGSELDETASRIQQLTDVEFRQWVARVVNSPNAPGIAHVRETLRHPALILRTSIALRTLANEAGNRQRNPPSHIPPEDVVDYKRRQGHARNLFGAELALVRQVQAEQRQARMDETGEFEPFPGAPNARSRAARELQKAYPVEYLALVRKHEALIAEQGKGSKKKRKKRAPK